MEGKDGKTYVFDDFWDFVVLCIRVSPKYTLRTYLYALVGWMLGAAMGLTFQELTVKWAAMQALILLVILSACTWITLWSLRKEWDYLKSTNLVRRVPKEP